MNLSSRLHYVARYISFLLRSHTKYSVHSPFVYNLIVNVLEDHSRFPEYNATENIRKKYLHNSKVIEITTLGADIREQSKGHEFKQVCVIARSAISVPCGRLLYRLVKYFVPETLLELGTSLGISTMYMASAAPSAFFTTMEGCPSTAEIAAENLEKIGLHNIHMLIGEFSSTLPSILASQKNIDFAFFDGNHTCQATLTYFTQCLSLSSENSVFVFHDIHWSHGMEDAWAQICRHPQVTVSIDLFEIGMVFFRKGLSKQDFVIRI